MFKNIFKFNAKKETVKILSLTEFEAIHKDLENISIHDPRIGSYIKTLGHYLILSKVLK